MIKKYTLKKTWTEDDVRLLSRFGITREVGSRLYVTVEDEAIYHVLLNHFSKTGAFTLYWEHLGYQYSTDEVLSSEYCILSPLAGGGYPQPEGNHEDWCSKVYDMSRICMKCGCWEQQIGEFRINRRSKKPLWGFTSWCLDALFMTEELYKSVFEPLGLGCIKVMNGRGKPIPGILQLDIPIIDEELDLTMHQGYEICPECGKKKYLAYRTFPFFPLHENPLPHIYYSKEHFGSGGEAFRMTFVSRELARKLLDLKLIKTRNLTPCRKDLSEYLKTIKY